MPLTFDELAVKSRTRRDRWHGPGTVPWTGADFSNAMCGEAGEAANVVKKLRRHETGIPDRIPQDVLLGKLADELADTIAYAQLVADHYGIDLGRAVAAKFNRVSEREGFPERLVADADRTLTARHLFRSGDQVYELVITDTTVGVGHSGRGCSQLADVVLHLDAFYCPRCGLNGRLSGAWVADVIASERAMRAGQVQQ